VTEMLFLNRDSGHLPDWLPDIYYTAEYGATGEILDGGTWECAVLPGVGAYPYIRRTVPGDAASYDIVTPYGYGGPVLEPGVDIAALAVLREAFRRHSRERGLIAEFIRGNPLDLQSNELELWAPDSVRYHPTLAIHRAETPEDYFSAAAGRHRTAVRKAAKSGLSIRVGDVMSLTDSTSDFRRVYLETMDRVGAASRLRMGDEYYQRLVQDGLADRMTLVLVDGPDAVAAAAIFMHWGDRWHYHLSGSSPEGMRCGASNLMIDYVVRNLMVQGEILHLGGGVQAGDGLEGFKASMANRQLAVPLCSTVINHGQYDDLVAASGTAGSPYFPAYRG